MLPNKKTTHSLLGLISLVVSTIVFISVNYMWVFVPYQNRSGILKIAIVNILCIVGFFYGKKKILEGKKGPR